MPRVISTLECLLSLLSSVEMTRGIKPTQSPLDLLDCLLGLHRLIKKPLGLAPGATRTAGQPSRILTATLGVLDLRIGFGGRLHLTLHLLPHALQDPLQLTRGVKDIETHGDRGRGFTRGLASLVARGIGQLHPALKSLPPIGSDMLKVWPLLNDFTPTLATAIRTTLPRQPSQADGLNTHQNGLAMKKDFVQTHDQRQALASPIQDLQDATRLLSALLHPAPHRGPAWHHTAGQHNRQQDHNLCQAQTHGTARRRQLALLGLAEVFRLRPGLPKGLIFGLELLILSPQVFIRVVPQ